MGEYRLGLPGFVARWPVQVIHPLYEYESDFHFSALYKKKQPNFRLPEQCSSSVAKNNARLWGRGRAMRAPTGLEKKLIAILH